MPTKPSKAKPTAARVLSRQHFAFMRALVQGLDERRSWDQYLAVEGEHTDLRTVRSTIAWIRDAFAAAARRENRPGTARLILLDPERLVTAPQATPVPVTTPAANSAAAIAPMPAPPPAPKAKPLPTLEEFAAEHGMEDFSEDEQIEAYQLAYPTPSTAPVASAPAASAASPAAAEPSASAPMLAGQGGEQRRLARRARVITRQIEALRWLEELVAQDPRPGDGVAAWLNPSLASRLERAGVPTLFALVERINGIGARWWLHVPGVGERKAGRILDWLRDHQVTLGMTVGGHVAQRRSALTPTVLKAVVPPATEVVPFEKFIVPAELDGSQGQFRGPPQQCLLMARNDYEAIAAWLSTKQPAKGEVLQGGAGPNVDVAPGENREPRLSATQRAYRKEAERLLLWAVLVRGKPLSSLTVEDATAYRGFLASPPATWCGPRHHQRWSPLWRPLEGPLAAGPLRYALDILRSLYGFWMGQNYVVGNPFAGVAKPANPQRPLGSGRTLTFAQWDYLNGRLEQLYAAKLGEGGEPTEVQRRLRRAVRWLYATGLRLAEITAAKCGHLEPLEYRTADGATKTGWLLQVLGKGERLRQVPVPLDLVAEFQQELARQGREPLVSAVANQDLFILSRFDPKLAKPAKWSASGLYKAIKALVEDCAESLDGRDAEQLRKASTHWLRHSHASHALQGRSGRAPAPLQVVQNNLGHASLGTSSQYLTTERENRLAAMESFWGSGTRPVDQGA